MKASDCVILGIGNLLMGDDGLGVHAVRYLEGRLPGEVDLVEGGVYGADLLTCLENKRKVVFIDGIEAGDEPGAVYRFPLSEVSRMFPSPSMSMHDFGLYDLVAAAELLGQCPEEIVVIAVQVKEMGTGMELSPELEAALPRIHELVLEELHA